MGDRLSTLQTQLLALWREMPAAQRMTLAVAVIGVTAILTALGGWSSAPEYEPVVADLSEEEVVKATQQLQGESIPYKLSANNRSISVPAAQAGQARLKLATAGISGQTGKQAGYELLDKGSFGQTEQVQRLNYQRALEGELAKSIGKIDGVQDARVHLVLPVRTVFADRKTDASASVVVNTKGGRSLDDEHIAGIVGLVMGSVEDLKAENISLIDTRGRMLNDGTSRGEAGARITSNQYQQQRRMEADVSSSLTRSLERVVGVGNAVVKVAATLDWDQVEKQTETYTPQATPGAVRSQRTQTETSGAGATQAGGVPGTASNVPSYQAPAGGGTTGYDKRDNIVNYELDKVVEKRIQAPGAVKKLSVMAIVDDQASANLDTEELSRVLSAAAQLNTVRGDTVVVTRMPFNNAVAQTDAKSMEDADMRQLVGSTARTAGYLAVPLLALAVAFLVFRRSVAQPKPMAVAAAAGGMRVREITEELEGPMESSSSMPAVGAPEPQVELPAPPPMSEDEARARLIAQQIANLAKSEPQTVSQLISTLLEEGRR